MVGHVHYSQDPQVLFFNSKNNFKTRSHDIIHTFKNYFTAVFSIFNNKRYPNRPIKQEKHWRRGEREKSPKKKERVHPF